MDGKKKETFKITFDEDPAIVQFLDEEADRQGTTRASLIRRAIRQAFFSLPAVPVLRKLQEHEPIDQTA